MARPEKRVLLPLDQLFPPSQQELEYWGLLGRLVDDIAHAELLLNLLVIVMADVSPKTAIALCVPLRIDAASQAINRIVEVKALRGRSIAELQDVLKQLGFICRVRNDLVHRGVDAKEKHWETTNRMFARSKSKIVKIKLNKATFDAIHYDMCDINFRLMRHCKLLRSGVEDTQYSKVMKGVLRATYAKPIPFAWQYTPPKQAALAKRSSRHYPLLKPLSTLSHG